MAKEFLSSNGIEFTAIDVSSDEKAMNDLVEKTGAMATPVIIVGEEVIKGWDRGRVERALGL